MHTPNGDVKKAVLPAWQATYHSLAPLTPELHALALLVNAEIDRIVDERQWVSGCDYSNREEWLRIKSIRAFPLRGDRLDYFGSDFVEWILRTALKLWENGYTVAE